MANTVGAAIFHLIFAVKNRNAQLLPFFRPMVHSYMATILNKMGHKTIIVGGVEDHVHILFYYDIKQLLPDTVRELKTSTSKFIIQHGFVACKFEWQSGYCYLSYSKSQIDVVKNYIQNQVEHHHGMSFIDEYRGFLDRFGLSYKIEYLPTDPM